MVNEMHLLLILLGQESADWGVQEVASLEEVELEDEKVSSDDTAELLDEVTCGLCGTTCIMSILGYARSILHEH